MTKDIWQGSGSLSIKKPFNRNTLIMILADISSLIVAGGFALLVRFDFSFAQIPQEYLNHFIRVLPLQVLLTLVVFLLMHMYHFVWRSVSAHDVVRMVPPVILADLSVLLLRMISGNPMPRSVTVIELMCQILLLIGSRCFLRLFSALSQGMVQRSGNYSERIMLIGAGEAGRMLAREYLTSRNVSAKLCCVIDDNEAKWGKYLEGIPVIGGRDKITEAANHFHITQIIFAIPTATAKEKKDILEICRDTGCRVRTVPGLYQLVSGEVTIAAVKDIQMEDLLGREPVKLNMEMMDRFLSGRTVLVTGGGGSIGSELCRQIAKYHPKKLIIVDIYENNAYDIQQELLRTYGDALDLRVEIASVRDKERIYGMFEALQPEIVFHAAAHKHVPLMEECPAEAIKNNIFGTYHVVRAAEKFGVKKFVMISTDKAVNPTNIMGATKRFCEMILQSRSMSTTEFCAVRFGNVLGSNGSVVPLFRKQIESGGPVTITDKRIIRYFMTIPEAAQLVLEAGAMARQSQIFVLDMGDPVKILDLAEDLIRLSGLEPYRDIEIREIGLRPGEKLYEELLMKSETLIKTENSKIFIEQQQYIDPIEIKEDLQYLDRAVSEDFDSEELISILQGMIPTYHTPEEVNRQAETSDSELATVV
ncbi:MAG: polysaccharide biosynthesis protein [Oscillospiraceae bacterium]|nr:polysaccharide biosynthesis protein [Oscillospiraceae bacterium]